MNGFIEMMSVKNSSHPKRPMVLYDSGCGICVRFARSAKFLDPHHKLNFVPLSQSSDAGVELPESSLYLSFHVIDSRGRMTSGADAIPSLFEMLPSGRLASEAVAKVGPLGLVVRFMYRTISRLHSSCSFRSRPSTYLVGR